MKKLNFIFPIALILFFAGCQSTNTENASIQDLIKQGKIEEAKSYFSTKSDINEQDEDGNTVLHIAALTNNEDLISFLIIKGADTEIKNFQSQTPLIIAIDNDCYDSVRTLTMAKADIFAKNADGVCALESALLKKEVYYDLMINETTSKMKDEEGKTIIHYFAEYNVPLNIWVFALKSRKWPILQRQLTTQKISFRQSLRLLTISKTKRKKRISQRYFV